MQQSRLVRLSTIVETGPHRFRFCTGQHRHTIVAFHTSVSDFIPGRQESHQRELAVLDFGFLQAQDIGFFFLEPVEDDRKPSSKRIYIIGGDFHDVPQPHKRRWLGFRRARPTGAARDQISCCRRLAEVTVHRELVVREDPERQVSCPDRLHSDPGPASSWHPSAPSSCSYSPCSFLSSLASWP